MKEFFSAMVLVAVIMGYFTLASKGVAALTDATFGQAAAALTVTR